MREFQKPWGSEWEVYADERMAVWKLQLKGNEETSLHSHPNKTTVLIVDRGSVALLIGDRVRVMALGDYAVIPAGVAHKTVAHERGATVIEIESPPNKEDLVRLSDKYGRTDNSL